MDTHSVVLSDKQHVVLTVTPLDAAGVVASDFSGYTGTPGIGISNPAALIVSAVSGTGPWTWTISPASPPILGTFTLGAQLGPDPGTGLGALNSPIGTITVVGGQVVSISLSFGTPTS